MPDPAKPTAQPTGQGGNGLPPDAAAAYQRGFDGMSKLLADHPNPNALARDLRERPPGEQGLPSLGHAVVLLRTASPGTAIATPSGTLGEAVDRGQQDALAAWLAQQPPVIVRPTPLHAATDGQVPPGPPVETGENSARPGGSAHTASRSTRTQSGPGLG